MRTMPQFEVSDGYQFAGSGMGGGDGDLPVATSETLGGIKVGENLSIDEEGVLSAGGGGISISTTETKIGSFLGVDLYAIAKETTTTPTTSFQEYFNSTTFYINPMFGIWYCTHSNGDPESIPIAVDRATYHTTYHIKLTTERRDSTLAATRQYFIFFYTK